MGCVANKPLPEVNKDTSTCTSIPSYAFPFPEKNLVRSKLTESIKKRDIILFKKAIQQFQIQPSEFIGLSEQAKTVLHKLAECNFSSGMALILEEMSAQNAAQLSQVLNMKDSDGNTPLLLCCLSNAVETLEVLSRCQNVDLEAKNCANKTALEIAIEMESPCVNILTSISSNSIGTTKNTVKSESKTNSQPIQSEEEDPRGIGFEDAASGNFDTRTSLDGKSASQALENINSKDVARYVQLLADLRAGNADFVDIEFPHEMWCLENEECEGELSAKYPEFTWVKPSKFMEGRYKNAKIFENFECNSVAKTPLAGCEVYSALAAMAEYPSKLLQVFNTKEINASGLYSVNFTVSGVPIEILLDDYFPSTDGTQMLYSKPLGNEIWFSLLEKAFAKLHGGYSGLETIGILEAMETLTGMPVVQKSLNDAEEDKLWAKLIDYDKKNYILCVGENKRYQTSSRNRNYSIVGVMEVDNFKLIKLRNHFDNFTWTGDFSSRSPLWTKELKEKVGYCETDNTCFYMQLKDFVREFDFLTVCYYHENWINNRLDTACEPNHAVYFELNIEKETEVYISVHQKSQKFVDEEVNYSISPVEIIVAKDLDGTNLEGIAFGEREAFLGKPTVHFHENYRVKLQPGRYLTYVKVKWIDGKKHDIVLNVHSSSPVKLNQLEAEACPDFLEKVYLNAGSMCKDKFSLGQDCVFSSGWVGSHLWMYAYNYGKKTWHLEISFEKMMNIQLGKKGRVERNVIKLVIPPQQKAIAYAKRTDSGIVSLGWDFKQKWE